MEKKVILVCIIVAIFGALSAALGFAAEAKRIKANQIHYVSPPYECIYPRSPALALGLTAAVALLIAQTIINATTGCLCCRRGTSQFPRQTVALVCSTLSWFTFVIAVMLLLVGAALNDERGEESAYFGNYYCFVVKRGVFAVAASLSLATVISGILSYIMLESAKNRGDPWARSAAPEQSDIAMGQPQLPQQRSQDPVFVHEDTYMRRQIA